MIEFLNPVALACFVGGFALAVGVFWSEIRLGVQLKREARKKMQEGATPT